MKVNCLYRYHPKGEILKGIFDTDLQVIENVPRKDFYFIPAKEGGYYWCKENYSYVYSPVPFDMLISQMLIDSDVYLAIDLNCVGVINVKDYEQIVKYVSGQTERYLYDRDVQKFKLGSTGTCNGLIKTEPITMRVMQPVAQLVIDEVSRSFPIVHTRYGDLEVTFRYDNNPEGKVLGSKRFLEMIKREDAFCTYEYQGVEHLAGIKENLLINLD